MILNEYSKTAWINGASPDINKANLDNLEQGVYDVTAKAMELAAYETNAAASATAAAASATAANASATAAAASAVSAAASAAVYTDLAQDVADLTKDIKIPTSVSQLDFINAQSLTVNGDVQSANGKFMLSKEIEPISDKITFSNVTNTSTYLLAILAYYGESKTFISMTDWILIVNNELYIPDNIDYRYIRIILITSPTTNPANFAYWSANATFTLTFDCLKCPTFSNLITVSKNGGMYNTIQEAVRKCSNTEAVIQVYPDEYVEKINTQDDAFCNKSIVKYLTGVDRDKCRVVWHNNAYGQDTLWVGMAHVKNMSFISDTVGYTGATGCGYALHLDNNWFVGRKVTFENCYFYAQLNAAVGIGTRPNCDIIFRNCIFESDVENFGTVFFHNSNDANNLGANQRLTFINCEFRSKYTSAIYVQRVRDDTNTIELTMINCSLYSEQNGISNVITIDDSLYTGVSGNNINVTIKTFGNNVDVASYFVP